MLNQKDRLLLKELQNNFPVSERPYFEIGRRLGLSEPEVIRKLKKFKKNGLLRYVGAIFDTKKLRLKSSLVAMAVPKARLAQVTKIINSHPEVSHNYLRDDIFNVWFTVSAGSKQRLKNIISQIKKNTKIAKTLDLATKKVFKIDARFKIPDENR
jgi:DNA-binding Lrp family transcriptional regulator